MRWLRPALLASLLIVAPGARATVDCTVTAVSLIFPAYDTLNISDGVTNLTVACVRATGGAQTAPYTIALSTGSGTYAARTMTSGAETLNYNLYTTAARNIVWGDGSGATQQVAGAISVPGGAKVTVTATHTVYGRISAPQNVAAGTYVTTSPIVVTVTY